MGRGGRAGMGRKERERNEIEKMSGSVTDIVCDPSTNNRRILFLTVFLILPSN